MTRLEQELDPDIHLFNNLDISCDYFTEEPFKDNIDIDGHLSVIHFNSRSLGKNIEKIKELLDSLFKCNIVAVSETWLNEDKMSEVQIEGYDLVTVNRNNPKGGGVALYIDSALQCKLTENNSVTVEDVLECVTVETELNKLKMYTLAVYTECQDPP